MSDRRESRFRKRKTRWTDEMNTHIMSSVSAIPKVIPWGLTIEQIEALQVRVRIEELSRKLTLNELDLDGTDNRSPSPEPIYDQNGKRVNTRDQRARERLLMERHGLVQLAIAMWPHFRPPADYQPMQSKKTRRIMIPVDKHPEYNFIGLIIGPRGNTQKRMERESGCKISIRGKGSIKEGKSKRDGQKNPDDDDPLHVLLTADSEMQLEKATKMVTELLIPVEEGKNEHKRQQLRELATINGTLRDNSWMQGPIERTWEPAKVKCQVCGEVSHPTSDCPMKGKNFAALPTTKQSELESELDKFMSEIGEGGSAADDIYNQFKAEIASTSPAEVVPPWQQPQAAFDSNAPPPWATGTGGGWAPPEQAPYPYPPGMYWGAAPPAPPPEQ